MLSHKGQIGRLDRLITFQSKITEIDSSNSDAETGWQDEVTVWCSLEDERGSELIEADQIRNKRRSIVTIRYRTIDLTWRGILDGEKYSLISVQRPDRKGYLKILVELAKDFVETQT